MVGPRPLLARPEHKYKLPLSMESSPQTIQKFFGAQILVSSAASIHVLLTAVSKMLLSKPMRNVPQIALIETQPSVQTCKLIFSFLFCYFLVFSLTSLFLLLLSFPSSSFPTPLPPHYLSYPIISQFSILLTFHSSIFLNSPLSAPSSLHWGAKSVLLLKSQHDAPEYIQSQVEILEQSFAVRQ